MTLEEKERSLAEFEEFLRRQAGEPVEVAVPRTFALAIDYEDVESNAEVTADAIVAVGIECDTDALVRVRNPYTRRSDNYLFTNAAQTQSAIGAMGGGPVRLIWGEPIISA